MAKKSSITDIIAGAGNYVVTVRETRASGYEITHRELYHPTPSSLRRVLRAIAKMAGVDEQQPNRIAQAEEAERKARTR